MSDLEQLAIQRIKAESISIHAPLAGATNEND